MSKAISGNQLDTSLMWSWNPKQVEMAVTRASNRLCVGGIRSGKTTGALMFGVIYYCLKYQGCAILVLRRKFQELEEGAIQDLHSFVPEDLFEYNKTNHTATFFNGSRIVFGHCAHDNERDIFQYFGTAYPFILIDECAQFSRDAWEYMKSRNSINPGCKPDDDGNYPTPVMIGCTNPIGVHWDFYKTVFVDQQPFDKPDGARQDRLGRWFVEENEGNWRCIHDPAEYKLVKSTVFDNPQILAKDPTIIQRLNALPKAKRDKMLLGEYGDTDGLFFNNFTEEYNVINLREDPQAIIWQDWQPKWMGVDYGLAHYTSCYWFTKALVRAYMKDHYVSATVCYREHLVKGVLNNQLADDIHRLSRGSEGKAEKISVIYFSWEKFRRSGMEAHTPADEFSRLLRERGLPSVSPSASGKTARPAGASLIYNLIGKRHLVITDNCPQIIQSLKTRERDPKNLDDVYKPDGIVLLDDAYDGFRYGVYGYLNAQKTPKEILDRERAAAITDPFARWCFLRKQYFDKDAAKQQFSQQRMSPWMAKEIDDGNRY